MHGVVGLDLSLSRTGICYIPPEWGGTYDSLRFASIVTTRDKAAYGRADRVARLEVERCLKIADRVVKFVKKHSAEHVAVERYAYSFSGSKNSPPSSSVTKLAELGGIVKSQLILSCRTPAVSVASNAARSELMGGMKKGKQKEQVQQFMKQKGFQFENLDEMDAFVVGYYWYCKLNDLRSRFLPQQLLF